MPSRNPRKRGNDEDFVPATVYPKRTKTTHVPELPNDRSPPQFDPLPINNICPQGAPNLPPGLDDSDALEIFRLFFTDELMELLVHCTNANAKKARFDPQKTPHQKTARIQLWKDVSRLEMYGYFGVLIYMGIHKEPAIEDYWKKGDKYSPTHPIAQYISRDRFQAIDQWLYCEDPSQSGTFTCPFERIWTISEHLRKASRRYYTPGTHLTIDESIKRFTGRAKEIVNIPSKPTPEGFKMWVLSNEGYVLDWLFHSKGSAKGQGPYRLDTYWTREEKFTPTEAVVLDLLLRRQEEGSSFSGNCHIIWIDNLFTSVKLLERLRQEGIGGAGTVRTVRTKREENLDKEAQKKAEKPTENLKNASQISQILNHDLSPQTPRYLPTPEPSEQGVGSLGNLTQSTQVPSQNLRRSSRRQVLTRKAAEVLENLEIWRENGQVSNQNEQFPSQVLAQVLNQDSWQGTFQETPHSPPPDSTPDSTAEGPQEL